MDTSETYIKMCDCSEIQENREPTTGDWYVDRLENYVAVLHHTSRDTFISEDGTEFFGRTDDDCVHESEAIWLPRQDQLQEMVFDSTLINGDYYPVMRLLRRFYLFIKDYEQWEDATMEQLWLAFVMKEKHGKVWDGEAWHGVE